MKYVQIKHSKAQILGLLHETHKLLYETVSIFHKTKATRQMMAFDGFKIIYYCK